MGNLRDRLIDFARSQYGMGMTNFEKHTGMPSGTIHNIKDGFSTRQLQRIMETCPELNVNWLITGEGEMLQSKPAETMRVGNTRAMDDREAFDNRLKKFAASHGFSNVSEMAKACNLSPRTFYPYAKNGINVWAFVTLASKFPDADIDYLLTGRTLASKGTVYDEGGIPILPFDAIAGGLTENITQEYAEMLPTPPLTNGQADFAIRVDGDSMYPRYHSGDILFVRKITDPSFFQWGKVYVLATTQGCIVKRLYPDKQGDEYITCHSENTDKYPDYSIRRDDITGVGLVVGHLGLD